MCESTREIQRGKENYGEGVSARWRVEAYKHPNGGVATKKGSWLMRRKDRLKGRVVRWKSVKIGKEETKEGQREEWKKYAGLWKGQKWQRMREEKGE